MIKQITIELEEHVYKSLEFISENMNEPIEELILDSLYNHVADIEDSMKKAFGKSDNH